MSTQRTIDIHAHILDDETIRIIQREVPSAGIKLSAIDDRSGQLELAGKLVNPFPRGAWDLEHRLNYMATHGFDMQAVGVCPVTFLYDKEPELTLAVARIQNEQISALAQSMPDRFAGFGTLPMQLPRLAADELRHVMSMPGMYGIEIGAQIAGRRLDDPSLEPVWLTAAELGTFVLVHPMAAVGVNPGVDSYYLTNLLAHPFDTAIAAACLVFGGVLERHPTLKICMAHGGGFAPYQIGRLMHGWRVREEPKQYLKGSPQDSFDRLMYDSILHDSRPLQFLVDLVGSSRVLLGSDYPFDMAQNDLDMVRSLKIPESDKATILGAAACRHLGLPASSNVAAC